MQKIAYDIPVEMIQAATTEHIQAHPYDLCFLCPAHNITCEGPNETTMEVSDRIDRINKVAKKKNITRAKIAELSGIPETTVVSVLTKHTADPRCSTMRAISRAVNGECLDGAPCYMASLLMSGQITLESASVDEEALMARVNELETALKAANEQIAAHERITTEIHASYKDEMQAIRDKAERIADYLKEDIVKLEATISKLEAVLAKREEAIELKDRMIAKVILGE